MVSFKLGKMGDNQGLAKALEKLAEFLTVKAEGVPSPGALVPQPEVIQKIELMPNEIKTEGVTKYLSWSRRAGRLCQRGSRCGEQGK